MNFEPTSSFSRGFVSGNDLEFTLIENVKLHPELYNPHDESYEDKAKKDIAWARISKAIDKDECWCLAKWNHLIRCYQDRKRKLREGKIPTPKRWVYYDALHFLSEISKFEEINQADYNVVECCDISSDSNKSESAKGELLNQHPANFDETQYQSLDRIEERGLEGEIEVNLLTDDIKELPSQHPPPKRRKQAITEKQPNNSNGIFQGNTNQNTFTGFLPSIALVQGNINGNYVHEQGYTTNASSKTNYRANFNARNNVPVETGSQLGFIQRGESVLRNEDCPHYHFCMSLLARFRRMDDVNALQLQTKMMEVILNYIKST